MMEWFELGMKEFLGIKDAKFLFFAKKKGCFIFGLHFLNT
jgi:hypothetical protein